MNQVIKNAGRPICLVFLVLLFGAVGPASAALIDFETFPDSTPIPDGTRITDQFASFGVAMFATTGPGGPQILQLGLTGQSGVNALRGVTTDGKPSFFDPIEITFSSPILDASILALDVGVNPLMLEAFDSMNVVVASDSVVNPSPPGSSIGGRDNVDTLSVSGSDIVRLLVSQPTPGAFNDGYVIDDLMFTVGAPAMRGPAPIPEPGTLLLLGSGLVGMGVGARRRRRS